MIGEIMGKRQLVINLIANIIAFGTSLLISFVLTPYLISTIGKEAYGFYPLANNFVSYFMIITLALNSMTSRFITVEIVKRNFKKAKTYYSSVFYANIIMSIILFIPMVIVIILLDSVLNIPKGMFSDVRLLFIMIFSSMIINVITSVFGIATFAKNRLDLRSGGEIVQGLLKIFLYVFLYALFTPTIIFVGLVALILSVTNLFIQIFLTRKLLPNFNISYKLFDYLVVKELLISGIWNSINSLGSLLLLGISLYLTNYFLGASASGELSIVQILPQFISTIITMLFAVFMPRITHIYARGNSLEIVKEITFSQKIIGLLSSTPIILLIIFGQEFFSLWVPTEDSSKLHLLSIITLGPLIIHGNMWTVYGVNIVLNKVKFPSLLLIGFGIINLITSYILLKFFVTSIYVIPIVSGIINIVYYLYFIPSYAATQLNVERYTFHTHILKSILFSVALISIGTLFKQLIAISSWFELFLWGGSFGLVGIICNSLIVLSKNDLNKITTTISHMRNRFQYKRNF
jgi:O-antigen/teichoic acid export membrane protein